MNNKEELEKKTGVKHFDICLMNPPYSNKEQFLDMKFVEEVNKICDVVISVQPGQKFISGTSTINKIMSGNNFKEFEIFNANDAFNISTLWKYGGIYLYDNKNSYDMLNVTDINGETSNIEKTKEARTDFYNLTRFVGNIRKIINNKKELYNTLINDNKTMVNDKSNKLIYYDVELNRGKRFGVTRKNPNYNLQFVKDCLKDKKYKYCLYLGSFNGEEYVEPKEWNGENPNELFKKQVCWLTNSNTIKNNIKYWMASPLFDLWRRWFLNGRYRVNRIGCYYGFLPALDFEMNENDFKEYVDSLNDFTDEEIKILKENNIKNVDKLEKKTGIKKFDICLMNPPYDGNLHLKFLEKVVEVCNITINISPSDRFTNINLENKLSTKLAKYIDSLEIISKEHANSQFGIISSSNLGIGVFKKNAKGYEPKFNEVRKFIKLIRKEKSIRSSINFYNDSTRKYKYWCGVQGDYGYAKSWHYSLEDVFKGNPGAKMGFDTKEELDNFIKTTTTTWPYKLMYIVDDSAAVVAHLPFMKDYTRYYDDEYFYKYFNITNDERKTIEDFIKKHYRPINKIKNDK